MIPWTGAVLIALIAVTGLVVDRGEAKCGIAVDPLTKLPKSVTRRVSGREALQLKPITSPPGPLAWDALPWQAMIFKGDDPTCDGVFIEDPKVTKEQDVVLVLTLAGCVDSNALDNYRVVSSAHQKVNVINAQAGGVRIAAVYPPSESMRPESSGIRKPSGLPPKSPAATRTDKSFVVLKLAWGLSYASTRPICLATSSDALGINGLLTGWTPVPTAGKLALGMATVPVWNKETCSKVNEIDKTLARNSEFYCTPYYTYDRSGSSLISLGDGKTKPAKLFGLVNGTQPEGGNIIYVDVVKNAGKILTYIGKLMNAVTPTKQLLADSRAKGYGGTSTSRATTSTAAAKPRRRWS